MIGCHTARKPLLFICLRGVNDYVSDGAPRGSELETSQLYGHLPPVDGVDSVT